MIGQQLGHYKILDKLGEGGMGEVYRAEDSKLGREVAIKVLPEEVAADPERLARFEQEARTLAALDHPSIVTIYSVETATVDEGDVHFLTMQLIEGDTLDQRIVAEGLSIDRVFDYALPIAEAIAAAHDRGITHRDLKPGNVMVTPEGRVKVLDFGLAKVEAGPDAGEDLPTLAMTREGVVMGTAPYMSPEQAKGMPVDARSDVFSLGIVLYEMATGTRPFRGDTTADLVSSILRDTPPEIGDRRTDFPDHLRRVIGRCLEKQPEERYQTAGDMAIDLRGLQREWRSGELTPAGRSRSAASTGSSELAIGTLPINCSTDDEELRALAEGLTEDITTGLARFSYLSVVQESAASGDTKTDARTAAQNLGVRYLLTGSIRRAGSIVRANLHILDAASGGRLWAEAYDHDLEGSSLFEIQDELTDRVVATIADQQGVLIRAMSASVRDKPVDQLSALEAVFVAFDYLHEITPEAHVRVREMLERVVESEPNSADAWAALSDMYCEEYKHDYNVRPDSLGRAIEAARRAIAVDRTHQLAYHSLAEAQFFRSDLGAFRSAADRAVQLNPRNGNTLAFMGILRNYAGDWAQGTPLIRRALELNPNYPGWYRFGIFYDHFRQGQFEEALAEAESIDLPGYYPTFVSIAAAAGHLGRSDVAHSAVEELLRLYPAFAERGRAEYGKWVREETVLDSVFEGLRLAGLEVADARSAASRTMGTESTPPSTAP
ncbi:MAG: protein kinase [Thermoanaerobaculia bacterium]